MSPQPEAAPVLAGWGPRASGPIPSLDGVRGIAVSLVFLAHSGLENLVPGGLGVTIFFVLSGYLITTLMKSEYLLAGSIDYRAFYLRRLVRLMPPLLLVTAAVATLSGLSLIDGAFSTGGLGSVLFYFSNYYVIAHDFHGLPAGMGVVWSLAVEEHYYIFYPPLALLLLHLGNARLSAAILLLLCALVLAWRTWLALNGASPAYLSMATDTRVDAILVGCLMGFFRNPWLAPGRTLSGRRQWTIAATCCLVLIASLAYRNELFRLTLRYSVQSLAIAPLIYLAIVRADHGAVRWLNSKPMIYLGSISYTVYLSHQVLLFLVERQWPHLGWVTTSVVAALMTLAVAEAMRRWVELPCAAWRRRLHRVPAQHLNPGRDVRVDAL